MGDDSSRMGHLQISSIVPGPRAQVADLVCGIEYLPQFLEDHIEVKLIKGAEGMRRGAEYELVMTRFGFSQPVRLRVDDYLKGTRLTYRQLEGLFASWVHTIKFEDHGENQTLVTDFVDYDVPFGLFGHLADDLFIRRDMTQILSDRLKRVGEFSLKQSRVSSEVAKGPG
jgi:ligand-binding SRPBCC domain-containing protein